MPELPEVETVRRGLAQAMTGATFTAVEQRRAGLRFPFPERFAERLQGRRVEAVGRRAKYLVIPLDDGSVLAAHLGMTGSFRVLAPGSDGGAGEPAAEATPGSFYYGRGKATGPGGTSPHDHLRFAFDTGATITYNDPRRFGFMVLVEPGGFDAHPLFRDIGVEPLDEGFDARVLARLMAGRAAPLKAALLDQKLIAGLGNIYVCEALHRAGLSPERAASTLAKPDGTPTAGAKRLASAIRTVLEAAVEAGGSTLKDFRHADGELGTFQHTFRAYDREGHPCPDPKCRGVIGRIVQGGRSTFFCAGCQR
ncbi:bifunctional DNA-formamidopyrimidine glycosylase/DNA-(apurinic or apyrimidinic site) lyase [Lichenibacterium dinghuense]|uniref:bifunctional DNA-formamidopyrimidine glycosylase/DNA-(apurinic or apyrimidinic site) lyase n=1 Tax=Lichenibacterium dinghuense TaxID=2895977 RepID=UPI001F032692|nr:bifunctional DNA-formamidopyrimidine glycosylase/DNA-(apurinic or apyrimidinic site) lyase [Lichenibacterium sp. 6Y81]